VLGRAIAFKSGWSMSYGAKQAYVDDFGKSSAKGSLNQEDL